MYYVRFLKPPALADGAKDTLAVNTLVVVTTDLGETNCPLGVQLQACLVAESSAGENVLAMQIVSWTASSHALSIKLNVKRRAIPAKANLTLRVGPAEALLTAIRKMQDGPFLTLPYIIGSSSAPLIPDDNSSASRTLSIRNLPYLEGSPKLRLWEDLGPSIDRHVWDAGMAMVALLSGMLGRHAQDSSSLCQPDFFSIVRTSNHLRVIELGAGVGLVGLSLAQLRSVFALESKAHTTVLLTDVDPARSIAERNMASMIDSVTSAQRQNVSVSFATLDWEAPLPGHIKEQAFDLVLVSDCTYNPDSGPALVATLAALAALNPMVLVVVASKTRHASEQIFWDRMAAAGFVEHLEAGRKPLEILLPQGSEVGEQDYNDAEVVNVHLFRMQ